MIGRLLLWVILGFVAWWLLRARKAVPPPPSTAASRARAAAGGAPEAMVDCAHCGLHFPGSEAIRDGARLYCCTAHRDAGPRGE
ncbi:MAG TPA: PP0621 family protein [Burkholderiaceae bacterium]